MEYKQNQMYLTLLQTKNINELKGEIKRTNLCHFPAQYIDHPQTKIKKNLKQILSSLVSRGFPLPQWCVLAILKLLFTLSEIEQISKYIQNGKAKIKFLVLDWN